MVTAEHREPYEVRASRTVLGARRGEIPLRDSLVALGKLVEGANLVDDLRHRLLAEGLDTLGQHNATAAPCPAELVVEGSDLRCGLILFHNIFSSRRG